LAKESERIYETVTRILQWRPKRKRIVEAVPEEEQQ